MKLLFILPAFALFLMHTIKAQNVGIGTSTPNANAALEIKSNTKGLLMPRLSTTARNNMTNVAKGMLVYDTTRAAFYNHDGGKWLPVSQSNTDSLLRYTYPGVAPRILSMPVNGYVLFKELYGTIYDNGGQAGNYASNSDGEVFLETYFNDSAVLIKVEVVEMNIESPYDSLEIYNENDYKNKQLFTGNRTGTFFFRGDATTLHFVFRSNGVNNLSGFKINWSIITSNSQMDEPLPQSGWYFNSAKIAARAGVNINNNWAADSLGKYSFAFGANAVAKGAHSFTFGSNSYSLNKNSIAIGEGNKLIDQSTVAIGANNEVNGYASRAIGNKNKVDGDFSTAIGNGLIVTSDNSVVIGEYNSPKLGVSNRIFEIGNGTDDNTEFRSNALTIFYNGNTGIGTVTPTTKLDVDGGIRTKYSGTVIKSVTGTGSAALVNLTIPALPDGWDFTNTLVMVSVADGVSGIIYQTKLTSTKNIQLYFGANDTGPTRFNYIVFKL